MSHTGEMASPAFGAARVGRRRVTRLLLAVAAAVAVAVVIALGAAGSEAGPQGGSGGPEQAEQAVPGKGSAERPAPINPRGLPFQ